MFKNGFGRKDAIFIIVALKCFLLNLLPNKRVRGENAGELLRNKL